MPRNLCTKWSARLEKFIHLNLKMGSGASSSSSTGFEERRRSLLSSDGGLSRRNRVYKKSVEDDYTVLSDRIVGNGLSGPVRLAKLKFSESLEYFAVKRYDKSCADEERIQHLKFEAEVYMLVDHPNICKLFRIYEDDRYLWLVMEYCSGRELYQRLHEKKFYSEESAKAVTIQMLRAIHYLHRHSIVHRDLKLENWVYEAENLDRLKLIDFGFSKFWHPTHSKKMEASCGSLTYVSPETLCGEYTNACDLWSLGVIVYFLLVGVPPFFGVERVLINKIIKGKYSMSGERWDNVSANARDFTCRLLEVDCSKRMTSTECLSHPWLVEKEDTTRRCVASSSVLQSLREFAHASHLKRAALTIMAYTISTKDIEDLVEMFRVFDRNQDGSISYDDFEKVMLETYDSISKEEVEGLYKTMSSMQWGDEEEPEVCYSDFIAALLDKRLASHRKEAKELCLKFDPGRTGFITAQGLRGVLGDNYEGADVNEFLQSEEIDYNEFLEDVMGINLDDGCFDGRPPSLPIMLPTSSMKTSRSSPSFALLLPPPSEETKPNQPPLSPHARPWDSRLVDGVKECFPRKLPRRQKKPPSFETFSQVVSKFNSQGGGGGGGASSTNDKGCQKRLSHSC